MPPAKSAARLVDVVLFRAHLHAGRFKDMVASAKAIGGTICLEMDSGNSDHVLRFWADDADRGNRPICAMVGTPSNSLFEACEGDDEPHTIRVNAKHLALSLANLDSKRNVEILLRTEENKHHLVMQQAKDDDSKPDVRTITVETTEAQPVIPVLTKAAYATVDLPKFAKVLAGLKQSTDIVTLRIRPNEFEVHTSTRSLQDGWVHSASARGTADGIFAVAYLKKVVACAKAGDEFGEVHLAADSPLRISSVSEDLTIDCYVASSEVMK